MPHAGHFLGLPSSAQLSCLQLLLRCSIHSRARALGGCSASSPCGRQMLPSWLLYWFSSLTIPQPKCHNPVLPDTRWGHGAGVSGNQWDLSEICWGFKEMVHWRREKLQTLPSLALDTDRGGWDTDSKQSPWKEVSLTPPQSSLLLGFLWAMEV